MYSALRGATIAVKESIVLQINSAEEETQEREKVFKRFKALECFMKSRTR